MRSADLLHEVLFERKANVADGERPSRTDLRLWNALSKLVHLSHVRLTLLAWKIAYKMKNEEINGQYKLIG